MQSHLSQLVVALALSPIVSAVSLSDFKPRADNLPAACEKVYRATIPGCQPSDFTGATCGSLCIKALGNYVENVQKACYGQQGTNIITAFLTASGPSQLCSNAPSSPSPSPSSSSTSTSIRPTSTSSSLPSLSSPSTSTSSPPPTTMQTTTTSAISSDTATSQPTSTTSTQPAATSAGGGYGSPFDMATDSASGATSEPVKLPLALVCALAFGLLAF